MITMTLVKPSTKEKAERELSRILHQEAERKATGREVLYQDLKMVTVSPQNAEFMDTYKITAVLVPW